MARVAVVQFPGVNCETETARALRLVRLEAEVFRWTRSPGELRDFDAYVLPGGFSYQDRVRAGALAAKDPMVEILGEEAEGGKPVLGICNGAQVLVEAGLVPGDGGTVELALARNRMSGREGYFSRWVYVRVEATECLFTRGLPAGTLLPLPVAHGEGRFASRHNGRLAALVGSGQAPLRYADALGTAASRFPENPNGSQASIAGVCNPRGNVLALMPHPERAVELCSLPRAIGGAWGERRDQALEAAPTGSGRLGAGPGVIVFEGLRRHLVGES